jgi:hypothetical protein
MDRTRSIAVKLVDANIACILQKGKLVETRSFKGPIRLRLNSATDLSEKSAATVKVEPVL